MKVTVKLFALLGKYLPPGADGNEAELEAAEGATPKDIMGLLNLPPGNCHLVLVNGVHVEPGERDTTVLKDNDTLAIWPPVAGG